MIVIVIVIVIMIMIAIATVIVIASAHAVMAVPMFATRAVAALVHQACRDRQQVGKNC